MTDPIFLTVAELLEDPEPLIIPAGRRIKDKKSGELVDANVRFFLRRPNDVEKQLATNAANRVRRTLRALLQDPKSEEHELLLREQLEGSDDDTLRQLWVSGNLIQRAGDIKFQSLEEREVIPEPEGDVVTPAERDEYEAAIERAERGRHAQLIEALGSLQRELTEEAKAIAHDDLIAAAMPAHTETIVGHEWANTYTANLIARCTFSDAKRTKESFKSVAQVDKLRSDSPRVYQELADAHRGLLLLEPEPALGF